MIIKGRFLDEILRKLYERLLKSEDVFEASKGNGRDLLGQKIVLMDPRARISATITRGRLISALAEFCWYMSGCADLGVIRFYINNYPSNSTKGPLREAYGPRLRGTGEFGYEIDQVSRVIERLRKNPDTRRAVITLLESSDLEQKQKEAPCTIGLQFICRRKHLHLIAMMRSNDAYLGFPHDVFCFTMIQELIARSLGMRVGEYHHFATSLHLYEKDEIKVPAYLGEGFQNPKFAMPKMPYGCQMKQLADFLMVERLIRAGKIIEAGDISLPQYWKDLALVLLMHADMKLGRGTDARAKTMTHFGNKFYGNYFAARPKAMSKGEDKTMIQNALGLGRKNDDAN